MLKRDAPASAKDNASVAEQDTDQEMDVYSGVRWSAAAKYGTQAIEMVVSIIVARIVAPEAYGLLGMAVVITGFLMTFQQLGFGAALIQRKEIDERLTSSLFYVGLVVGTITTLLLAMGSPLASWAYSDPRVGPIVAVMSLSFLFSSPTMVPAALLQRRLAFRRLAGVDITVSLTRGVTVLSFAVMGWGVWAMVWSSLAGVAVRTPLIFLAAGWRPRWLFCWSQVRTVLSFGANLTGFSIFNYFARNADNFIIGAFLGATPLGYYSLAYRVLLLPRDAITGVLVRVLFPAFSRMQNDDERLGRAYLRACGAIAFITFPMMFGAAIVADDLVSVLLGEKWMPAVPLIQMLAVVEAAQSVGSSVGQLYLAKGRSDWFFRWSLLAGFLIISSFIIGAQWGVTGVAAAYAVVNLVLLYPLYAIPFRLVKGLRIRRLVKELQPYLTASAIMSAIVFGTQHFGRYIGVSDFGVLIASVCGGIVCYSVVSLCMMPPAVRDFVQLLPLGIVPKRLRVQCDA